MTNNEQSTSQREKQLFEYTVGLVRSGYTNEAIIKSLAGFNVDRELSEQLIAGARFSVSRQPTAQKSGDRMKSIQKDKNAARTVILVSIGIGALGAALYGLSTSPDLPHPNILTFIAFVAAVTAFVMLLFGVYQWIDSNTKSL